MNSLARRCTEQGDNRGRNRRYKPVCYKCGRAGHIQYNCYSYNQPKDQYQNRERNEYNPYIARKEGQHLSAIQYASRNEGYYDNKTESSVPPSKTSHQQIRSSLHNPMFKGDENSPEHMTAALPEHSEINRPAKTTTTASQEIVTATANKKR